MSAFLGAILLGIMAGSGFAFAHIQADDMVSGVNIHGTSSAHSGTVGGLDYWFHQDHETWGDSPCCTEYHVRDIGLHDVAGTDDDVLYGKVEIWDEYAENGMSYGVGFSWFCKPVATWDAISDITDWEFDEFDVPNDEMFVTVHVHASNPNECTFNQTHQHDLNFEVP
jgi:hypothetical protein